MADNEALRLADVLDLLWLDGQTPRQAAAELRRLAGVEAERDALRETERKFGTMMHKVMNERDALLVALKLARSIIGHPDDAHTQLIDAAIDAAKGGGNG